jgi:hypothetical protein
MSPHKIMYGETLRGITLNFIEEILSAIFTPRVGRWDSSDGSAQP